MRHEPPLVTKLTKVCDGWIVGSAADPKADLETVRDWDILVPFPHWKEAAILIPPDAKPNTFGGWKCISDGKVVDVWPGDLGWLLQNSQNHFIWHPRTGVRYCKV